jgi:putative SOS response-associated peptidase YedK
MFQFPFRFSTGTNGENVSPTNGEEVLSCTILTCGPNKVMGELHNRMPVILAEGDWPKWLGEVPASEHELLALLKPCPDETFEDLAGGSDGRERAK